MTRAYAEEPRLPEYVMVEIGGDGMRSPDAYRLQPKVARELGRQLVEAAAVIENLRIISEEPDANE